MTTIAHAGPAFDTVQLNTEQLNALVQRLVGVSRDRSVPGARPGWWRVLKELAGGAAA